MFAKGRALLAPVGGELAAGGRLAEGADIWHLTLPEIRRGLAGEHDHRPVDDDEPGRPQ